MLQLVQKRMQRTHIIRASKKLKLIYKEMQNWSVSTVNRIPQIHFCYYGKNLFSLLMLFYNLHSYKIAQV